MRRLPDSLACAAVRNYQAGKSAQKTAALLGISKKSVLRILVSRAIPRRRFQDYERGEEWRKALSKALRGRTPSYGMLGKKLSEDAKKKIGLSNALAYREGRRCVSETATLALIKSSKSRIGKHLSEECKKKLSKALRGVPKSSEHTRKVLLANGATPNKAELALGRLLDHLFPNAWRYVGDGSLIVGGKCPDFVNVNGRKQIIELFGDYWHRGDDPAQRAACFAPFGYETLVVWEYELHNSVALKEKLFRFDGGV